MKCKIRIISDLAGVWSRYQPVVGQIYDANYHPGRSKLPPMAVITIKGKPIVVRKNEFEVVEVVNG